MQDQDKTKQQLIAENEELRQRVAALEGVDAERKRAEEELARSKAILTAAVECLPFDFFALDPQGRCILQNALSRRYFGNAIGKTAEEVCPDERAVSRWIEGNRQALAGAHVSRETELDVGGEHRHFYSVLAPIQQDGTLYGMLGVNVDITERKRAEEALRKSEERYRTLAEASPDVIYILDRTGKLLYANRTAAVYMGLSPASLVGKTQQDLFPPDKAQHHRERIQRVFETGEAGEMEELYRFGSQNVWLNVRSIPLRDDQGRVTSVMGVCRNVTDRKRAEAELRQERSRVQQYLDVAGVIMVVLDNSGNIRLLNPKGYAVLGHDNGELLGKNWFDTCLPQRNRDEVRFAFRELIAGRIATTEYYENPVITKSGEERIIAWHNAVLTDDTGVIVGTLSSGLDISERKQAEEALRKSEERFRQAMEATNDGLWDWNVKSGDVYYSPAYSRILGYEPAEFANRTETWIDLLHPDDRAEAIRVNQACIENRIPHFEIEFRMRAKGGEWRTILGRGKAVCRDADGRAIRMIGTHVDITERKRAEEELAKSKAILQATIECLPFDFFAIGENGHYLLENAVCRAHWGRLVGKNPEDMAPNEHVRKLWLENNRRAFAGERVESETRVSVRGEERVVFQVIAPIRDETHSYGILGVNIDITARKRAEEALQKAHDELEERVKERTAKLREANERLRIFQMFLEASGQGFGMADTEGLITYMNPALCRMAGVEKADDAIGKHLSTYYPEGYMLKRETEILPALLQAGHWEGELVGSPGGRTICGLQNSFLIKDENGKPLCLASVITDITERKRIEGALRLSEERLRMAISATNDAIWDCNLLDGTVSWNDNYAASFGRPPETSGSWQWWIDHIHPEDRNRVASSLKEATKGSQHYWTAEYRFLRADGVWADILDRAYIAHNESGKAWRVVGAMLDITERKRAEEALRRSEESLRQSERRFRNYFEQGLIGMAVTSVDKRWLEVNDRLCEILGYSREELVQTNWVALTHPDDVEPNLRLFNPLLAGEIERFTLNKRYLKKDGSIVHTTIHTRAFRKDDGAIDHIVTLIEDITARKRAEEALRQSEERYRAVVEDQTEVISRFKADGTLTFANEVFCRFFGKTSQELLGRKWQPVALPADVPVIEEQLRTLSPSNPVVVIENRVSSGVGEVRWMQFVNRGFFDQEGRLTQVQAVGRDVTERHQAQEALERQRQSLWKMLQASDHERQIISYEIHDGLAQYLAAATMQFQAHDAFREHSPDKARKAYETATELVRQAHFEARRLISEVRPPVIDESGLETAISHLVHEQRWHGGPSIHSDINVRFKRLPSILENSLYRIAQEALANACNHSKSKEVKIILAQEGQDVRLEVQDWGIGFDPQSAEEGHFGVEGIRQRVRLLGGRLKIESTPNSGTLVQVVVPIVERKSEE